MRILMPIGQLETGKGGAETQAYRLAGALKARGHGVELLTSRPAGRKPVGEEEGVLVRRFFAFWNGRGVWRLGIYTYMGLLFRELMRQRGEHDIVHVHQIFHAAYVAVMARALGGAPVVVKVATAGSFGDLHQMRNRPPGMELVANGMLDEILKRADRFIAISSAIADELKASGVPESRIARIPNGITLPVLASAEERAEARRSLGLDASTPVAVYVGRAEPQKGADVLLEAWDRVRAELPGAKLLAVGQGLPERFGSRWGGRDDILMPGRVLDVPRYLKAADLFVLPSRAEGLSNAVLEAMSYGCACVVSAIPANRDLVEEGVTGVLVPVEDSEALASAVVSLLRDPERRRALGEAARRHVEQGFTMDSVVARYERLYAELLDEERRRRGG